MCISKKIRQLCLERGISVRQLEKAVGIGNGSVLRWEKQEPSAKNLQKVADYFGVSTYYLLDDEETKADYFIDPEVLKMAQELKVRPELKVLFDASKRMSKETVEALVSFIEKNK